VQNLDCTNDSGNQFHFSQSVKSVGAMARGIPMPVDLAAFANEHLSYEANMFAMTRDRLFHGVVQVLRSNSSHRAKGAIALLMVGNEGL